MNICLDPDKINLINNTLPNIFILGQSGNGRTFYYDENSNKVEDTVEEDE